MKSSFENAQNIVVTSTFSYPSVPKVVFIKVVKTYKFCSEELTLLTYNKMFRSSNVTHKAEDKWAMLCKKGGLMHLKKKKKRGGGGIWPQ